MSFMIETSARHIHLTQETVEKLFGKGYELTVRKPLSYPGQYACNERLTIVGPKKEMANVSILGLCVRLTRWRSPPPTPALWASRLPSARAAMWRAPAHVSWWAPRARWS